MKVHWKTLARVAACAVAAVFAAKVWLTMPLLWPWLPNGLWPVLDSLFSPTSQEEIADVEFLLLWCLSFALLSVTALIVRQVARTFSPDARNTYESTR